MAMTKQEIMNKVALHLTTQGVPAQWYDYEGHLSCAYRNDAGQMCSVGCLIEATAYDRRMEGDVALRSTRVREALVMSGVMDELRDVETLEFLAELQVAHDDPTLNSSNPENWLPKCHRLLIEVCIKHSLTVPECITDAHK